MNEGEEVLVGGEAEEEGGLVGRQRRKSIRLG
jgi:hypothetical protein